MRSGDHSKTNRCGVEGVACGKDVGQMIELFHDPTSYLGDSILFGT